MSVALKVCQDHTGVRILQGVWAICSASSIGTPEGVNDCLYPHLCNSKPLAATNLPNAILRDVTWVRHHAPEMHGMENTGSSRSKNSEVSNSAGKNGLRVLEL